MKIKTGVDIIEIYRIKESIENLKEKFINRIFTQKEIKYCESKGKQKYQHYAARFSAKEAVFKAISELVDNKYSVEWKDIEVIDDENGRPKINLINSENYNIESIDISISHCKEYAVASVVLIYNK